MKHPWVWSLSWLSAQPHKQLKGQVSVYSTMIRWETKNCFKLNWPQSTHTLKTQLRSLTEASIRVPKIDVCSSQEADLKKKKINHEGKEGMQPARSTVSATLKCSPHSHSPVFPGKELIKLLLLNKTGTVAGDDGSCWLYILICKSWGRRTASTHCSWIQWNHRSHRGTRISLTLTRSKTVPWLSAALQESWYNNRKTMDCDLSV